MISKNDCILLLTELQESGIDINDNIIKVLKSTNIPLEVLEFINKHRQIDLTNFYNKLRNSYNNKKSKLYINIINEDTNPNELISTLSSYALQAVLYSRNVDNSQMFLRHARVREVNLALAKYFTDFDLSLCSKLLSMIKTDMVACEIITGRRNKNGEVA